MLFNDSTFRHAIRVKNFDDIGFVYKFNGQE